MMDRRRREGIAAREHVQLDGDLVMDALVWFGWNESAVSRLLGMNRNTVRKIRRGYLGLTQGEELPDRDRYTWRTQPVGAPWVENERSIH